MNEFRHQARSIFIQAREHIDQHRRFVATPGGGDFRNAIADHYLTNPIARSSSLMAELSARAKARTEAPLAAE